MAHQNCVISIDKLSNENILKCTIEYEYFE